MEMQVLKRIIPFAMALVIGYGFVWVSSTAFGSSEVMVINSVPTEHDNYQAVAISPKIASALDFALNQRVSRHAYNYSFYCAREKCCIKGDCNERAYLYLDLRVPKDLLKKDPALRYDVTAGYSGRNSLYIKEHVSSGWEYQFIDDDQDGIPDPGSFRVWRVSSGHLGEIEKVGVSNRSEFIARYQKILDLLPVSSV